MFFARITLSLMLTLSITTMSRADVVVDTLERGSIDRFGATLFFPSDFYQVRAFGSLGTRFEASRNWFAFDLSGLTGSVTGAEITFFHPGENGLGSASYDSPDPSETVQFSSSAFPASDYTSGMANLDLFEALGTGTPYGTLTADVSVNTVDDSGTFQTITLDPTALVDIQTAIDSGETWLIGGRLDTWQPDPTLVPGPNPNANERVFRGSGSAAFPLLPPTSLSLTGVSAIPEPSSLAAILVFGIGMAARRNRGNGDSC